jgi:hypothetical protein
MPTPEEFAREIFTALLIAAREMLVILYAINGRFQPRLSVIDKLETLATRLRQSILQQAFTGELA